MKILIIMDGRDDRDTVRKILRNSNLLISEIKYVDSCEAAFREFDKDFDCVLIDHVIDESGINCIRRIRDYNFFGALILISNTDYAGNHEAVASAVRAMQYGADDFVFKCKLDRLVTAIGSAMERRSDALLIHTDLRKSLRRIDNVVERLEVVGERIDHKV